MTFSAQMARSVLTGKVANCRTVLQRALRDHSDKLDTDQVSQASRQISGSLKRLAGRCTFEFPAGH